MNAPQLSPILERQILGLIQDLGGDLNKPRTIADAILQLSDFYANFPEKTTPWKERWAQLAYIAYFMPLNYFRVVGAVARGLEVEFFAGCERVIDFGSGLGSATFALGERGIVFREGELSLETAEIAISLHRRLCQGSLRPMTWSGSVPKKLFLGRATLAVFSYSFTELSALPSWFEQCGSLMIVEPATRDDGRRLLGLREKLIAAGWEIWAPCTHQQACPLLLHSQRDWCHDRLEWAAPQWFLEIERHLPMRNGTLPFTYLLAKHDRAPPRNAGRLTGDRLIQKGMAKQMICLSSKRQFLSWQKREWLEYPHLLRGDLVTIPNHVTQKGQELRLRPSD